MTDKDTPRKLANPKENVKGLGNPWGEEGNNLIFLRVGEGGSKARDGKTWVEKENFYNFEYLDKTTHHLNEILGFMTKGPYLIDYFKQEKLNQVDIPGGNSSTFYLATGKKSSVTESKIVNIQPLP